MAEMCASGRHPWIPENIGSNGPGKQTCKPCRRESRDRSGRAKTCRVEGCARPSRAVGLCALHYERRRIHGDELWSPMTPAEIIAEVDWLLGGGMSTFYVAAALKRDRQTLARLLWRHGRPEVAVLFDRVDVA